MDDFCVIASPEGAKQSTFSSRLLRRSAPRNDTNGLYHSFHPVCLKRGQGEFGHGGKLARIKKFCSLNVNLGEFDSRKNFVFFRKT